MKYLLCVIFILFVANPTFAEENIQQEHVKQGFDYINAAHYREATKVFNKAIEANPENAEAYYGLGISYLGIGDTETVTIPQLVQEAIYSFKKALNFGITNPEIYYFLGLCYLALNEKDLAIKQYDVLEGLNRELADQLLIRIVDFGRLQEVTRPQVPFEKQEKN